MPPLFSFLSFLFSFLLFSSSSLFSSALNSLSFLGSNLLWGRYQCRKWNPDTADISSVFAIGDNYETTTIFLVTGAQYLSSAMAFNLGKKSGWVLYY